MYYKYLLIVYVIILVVVSLASLSLYKKDKRLAVGGKIRIKEKTLLLSGVIGGAIGSYIGRIIFHHKTDKAYFSIIILLSLIIQLAVLVLLVCKVVM